MIDIGTREIPQEELAHPAVRDGRNIDETVAVLEGEGAQQKVNALRSEAPVESRPVRGEATSSDDTYYGLQLLKTPVWKGFIPAYFYVGGVSGGCAAVAAAAHAAGVAPDLVRAARRIAFGGAVLSAGLLIADLGKPLRFINMMRVFRPTSPMNVGTWILSAFGAGVSGGALLPGRLGDAGAALGGLLGLPLATYTGVLLAGTAVPLWQEGHTALPLMFGASAAASTGSMLELLPLGSEGQRVARRLAIAGKAAELAAGVAFEREAGRVPRVTRPLEEGVSGALWKLSKLATAAGLALSLLPRKPRALAIAAGALGTLGALALRFGVTSGGKASARDPHAAIDSQRAGLGASAVE